MTEATSFSLLWTLQHCFHSKPAAETYQTGHEPYLGWDEGWGEMRTQCRPFRYQNKNNSFDFKYHSACPSECGSVYLCCLPQSWFHRQVALIELCLLLCLPDTLTSIYCLTSVQSIDCLSESANTLLALCVCVGGYGGKRRKRVWLMREERNYEAQICSVTLRDWVKR